MNQRYSDDVYQAAGMVAAQARCEIEAALGLMQARADAVKVSLEEIVAGVLSRTVRFDPVA
jgi:hypothetical protein